MACLTVPLNPRHFNQTMCSAQISKERYPFPVQTASLQVCHNESNIERYRIGKMPWESRKTGSEPLAELF